MPKVIATMDSNGHMRVFDLPEGQETKTLERVLKDLDAWDDESEKAVEELDYNLIDQILIDAGFPCSGRELIVDVENEIDVEGII